MGIDHIKLEIKANKGDHFKTWEESVEFANKCRSNGEHVCIVERFDDVFYVIETPDWGSDTSRENYFN